MPPEVDPNLVKRWLHICDTKHSGGCCRSLGDLNDIGTFAPKFFIDVVDSCVVRATLDCRYVALSYVWGDTKTTKRLEHVMENSSKLQEPNSLRNMDVPRTIHESMVLVKKIGLRYLWVDALCIIQNDIQMSHLQISKMDQIYAKACLTIIAASGDNAQAGLPGVHPRTQEKRQRICQLPGCDIATLICDGFPVSSIANSTWASRAWTMQEMLLSRRCLIFTEDQVYWVCREFTYLEEIALEDTAASLLHLLPWPISARPPTEPIPHCEYYSIYLDLVRSYQKRQLTYNADIINAFSGLTSALSTIQGDEYIWGQPQSRFAWFLAWSSAGSQSRNHACTELSNKGQPKKVPFPSWSWAAWERDGTIDHYFKDVSRGDDHARWQNPTQSITDFFITNQEEDFIPIHEGSLLKVQGMRRIEQRGLSWQGTEWGRPDLVLPRAACIGCLHCWASIAPLELHRTTLGRRKEPTFVSTVELSMLDKCRGELSRPSVHVTGFHEPGKPTVLDWDKGTTDSIILDFLPVCRIQGVHVVTVLCLLSIEWEDGVAYRVGIAFVDEKYWIATPNKRWQFVTLG